MKKIIATALSLMLTIFTFASTINWRLYTNNLRHSINLQKTVWISQTDGQRIFFNKQDGEGVFDNGIEFTYSPPIMHYNGMTATPDEPTEMIIIVNGKKINKVRLGYVQGKYFLTDKRGIKYFKR